MARDCQPKGKNCFNGLPGFSGADNLNTSEINYYTFSETTGPYIGKLFKARYLLITFKTLQDTATFYNFPGLTELIGASLVTVTATFHFNVQSYSSSNDTLTVTGNYQPSANSNREVTLIVAYIYP